MFSTVKQIIADSISVIVGANEISAPSVVVDMVPEPVRGGAVSDMPAPSSKGLLLQSFGRGTLQPSYSSLGLLILFK